MSLSAPAALKFVIGVAILLIAAFLRVHLLGLDVRFHPDEALFASFARDAAVRGEWLLPGNLDKTPLSIYLQAGFMLVMGNRWDGAVWVLDAQHGEFVARLVGVYAGVLLVAVTARLAHTLTRTPRAALIAALLMALSPYGIAFSASAFTDVPMVLFGVIAVWAGFSGRGLWAGVALALAYACKQQGVLYAPLVAVGLWLSFFTSPPGPLAVGRGGRRDGLRPGESSPLSSWRGDLGVRWSAQIHYTVIAFIAGVVPLIVWDLARPYPSVLLLAVQNNAPENALVPLAGWLPRLGAWWHLAQWMFGGALLTAIVLLMAGVGAAHGSAPLRWKGIYVIGYVLLHLLVPLNVYDRYVLPVVPLVAVLAASLHAHRIHSDAQKRVPTGRFAVGMAFWPFVVLVIFLFGGAWAAANNRLPIGGDKGQHDGIIALADYLNGREFGAIVYDRWLGWELNYYLGGWTDKRRAYYPTPQAMATDPALSVPDVAPRYLPAPRTTDVTPWLNALGEVGFISCVGYQDANFVVYVLSRPSADGETSAAALARAACYRPVRR